MAVRPVAMTTETVKGGAMPSKVVKTHHSIDSGPLMVMDMARDRESSGQPLDTYAVTMAGRSKLGPVAIRVGGVTEEMLRTLMDADVAACSLSLGDLEDA